MLTLQLTKPVSHKYWSVCWAEPVLPLNACGTAAHSDCCLRHYVMFVGNTGTGKTAIMMNKLRAMDPESMAYTVINMNSFSDAPSLQIMMEQPLEKKSGVRYGPPGSRRWAQSKAMHYSCTRQCQFCER